VVPLDGLTENMLLEITARVESRSAHPLAGAVLRRMKDIPVPPNGVTGVESLTGRGVKAVVDGHLTWVGNKRLMAEAGVVLASSDRNVVDDLQAGGKTVMLVAQESRLLGVVALADTVRPAAAEAVARVKQMGVKEVALLTGDHPAVAEAVARQAGVTRVHAGLMPEDKREFIRRMKAECGHVAMVGDGVNDAPALAAATVGIAMGGAGTDVALETADVALMGDDLSRLPYAIGIGRATRAVITQNLWIALGVIAILAVTSLAGLAGIGAAIALHEGSTLVVALNSLRLLGWKPREEA
jgi:Cd2+/Zn2+-exporting ATPase